MRFLLVEDEPDVASFIKRALEEEGFEITVAMDGNMAVRYIEDFQYDLFIFDQMLPGVNGLELCRLTRKKNIETPILMLTALTATDNVVMGLDSGADDYLVKPFKLAELNARIRALVRRHNAPPGDGKTLAVQGLLVFADITLSTVQKTVWRNNRPIDFTATEFRLLEYFMRNPKKVLSRMEILEQVWGYDFNLNTKVVDVYINYLRKKLDGTGQDKVIHTVVGMGYILKEE